MQDACGSVDIRAVEAEQLLRPEAAPDRDDRDRPVAGVKLLGDRLDFRPRLERERVAAFVPLSLRVADPDGGVTGAEAPRGRPGERLSERAENVVAGAGGERGPPVLQFEPVQRVGMSVAESGLRVLELLFELPPCRRVDGSAVPLEEHVHECGNGLRPVLGRDDLAAAERGNLLHPGVKPVRGRGAGGEAALATLISVLVTVTGLPRLAALNNAAPLSSWHLPRPPPRG